MAGELETAGDADKHGGCAVFGEVDWAADRILGYGHSALSNRHRRSMGFRTLN